MIIGFEFKTTTATGRVVKGEVEAANAYVAAGKALEQAKPGHDEFPVRTSVTESYRRLA